ncbi:mitochondrial DNA helicase [Toxorhynchites rutilus septentrionalis]|uniref:mitochondrial DNA helicase n=1 Tax=Toxorhynchites rutilus septentrionalis TaxID=329112 RepID=UPI0024796AD6|nr:mitochondrial DNA helicase [Toxorhynchites rutilus septentrionalis]
MFLKRLLLPFINTRSSGKTYTPTSLNGKATVAAQLPTLHVQSTSQDRRYASSLDSRTDSTVPGTSLFNVRKTIKLSSLESSDGFTCIRTVCPVCHTTPGQTEDCDSNRETIYINKTTSNFTCSACQYLGQWEYIEKFFLPHGKSAKTVQEMNQLKDAFLDMKRSSSTAPVVLPEGLTIVDKLLAVKISDYFGLKEIPPISFVSIMSQWDDHNQCLYVPLIDVESRMVGYKVLSISKHHDGNVIQERTVPETNCSGLVYLICSPTATVTFGKVGTKEQSNAILVLNVLDLLALSATKINATAVCLPHDLKSLPQQCLPGLERFQKLTLWFNYDTAGWDIARNYAKKLEERRCMFVRPTDLHPTPAKALSINLDLKAIYSKAQPILHKSITTFQSLRQDVLSDLQNIDKVQGVKWKRYPTLNKLLRGHRKGELTVLTGPTGCGKTTFMSDYSLDLALQGVSTLWGSFEIRNTRLASTLLRQMAGRPLDVNLSEFDYWADAFEQLPVYFMTFHGQQPIKVVMEAIEHAQYVHDIHHVIIDNLQFMMGMSEESKHLDRYWKQDAIIAAFRTFATRKNCHVTLVIHPRKERDTEDLTTSSIFGGAKASQEADNVLIIQDKRLTSVRGKKYLQVAKNRYSGDLGIMPLDFDKMSLSYAQKRKKVEPTGRTANEVSETSDS